MIDLRGSFISCILLFQVSWRLYVISHFQKRWILVLYGGRETSEVNKVYPEFCTTYAHILLFVEIKQICSF